MISCPNKSSREWQSLSSELGEERAMLSYIRNNATIPNIERARELITNRGMLESFDTLPVQSEEGIIDTLRSSNLIYGDAIKSDGKTYYQFNPRMENIAHQFAKFTETYGPVLEYKSDYVTINQQGLELWNGLANTQALQNQSLTQLSKNFLQKIGVGLSEQDNVIKKYGSNGIADFAERMVRIQSGMMDEALPEEALHFFLDMMDQSNPALMESLDKIRNTKTYKETLEKYKKNPNYLTKEGQVRFDKIRKEALAKELASQMKGKTKSSWFHRILDAIINWIKSVKLKKTSYDILSDMFYDQDISRLNTNIKSSELYNQLEDKEKAFYESQNMNEDQRKTLTDIIAYAANTEFDEINHVYKNAGMLSTDRLKAVTTILGSDFISDLDNEDVKAEILSNFQLEFANLIDENDIENENNSKKIADHLINSLITGEITKEQITEAFGGTSMDALAKKVNDIIIKASEAKAKTLFGTAIHKIVENVILGKDFDLDEIMASQKIENIALSKLIDRKTLDRIVNGTAYQKGLKDIIRDIRVDGSIIMTELSLSNAKLGGTIDIIAIRPNGVVDIYDFKTKFAKNFGDNSFVKEVLTDEFNSEITKLSPTGVKDDPDVLEQVKNKRRSNLQKYTQQLSIYKKMLMEGGIRVGTLNVIGVPYRLSADTRKVTEIKTVLLENIAYDPTIANYYFSSLDQSFNAVENEEVDLKNEDEERLKTLEELGKKNLKEAFVKVLARLTQISDTFRGNKNVDELYTLLNNEQSKTNKLDIQKSNVVTALNNFEEVENFANIQVNFLEMIDSSVPIIQTAMKYYDKLKKDIPTDREGASQRLNELMKVKDFLIGYKNMFDELLKYMGDVDDTNPLVEKLSGLSGVIEKIRNNYIDVITPEIAKSILGVFDEDSLNTIKRQYNQLIAAARTRGDEKRAKMLEEERDSLPSEEVIKELLKGEKGDSGWFFSKLMATISNPDIILAGVAKKLKATLDRVRLENKKWRDSLDKEFTKRSAVYGRGMDIKNINKSLVYVVEEFIPGKGKEKPKVMNVLHFKSEFDERLYADHARLIYALKQAIESEDKDAIRKAKKDKSDFEREYMQTGYTNAYYEMTKPLDAKVMHQGREMTIREVDADIRGQIKQLEAKYSDDDKMNGSFNPEYIKELQKLNDIRTGLREKLDEFGNPKTGDALKIAEILEQYDKDKSKLFEFVDQTEYYNRAREKAKLEYGENSEKFRKWVAQNTRMVVKDEFYKKRQSLLEEKAALEGTLQSKEVADLYKELATLTKPYRDKDGNIKGNLISDEKSKKIKEIENKLDTLKSQDINFRSGFTADEQSEYKALIYARKNKLPHSNLRLRELEILKQERIAEKELNDPEFAEKIERLDEIRDELFALSKREKSKYYEETLLRQEEIFAENEGITHAEMLEGTNADGEKYYKLFKQSEWYQQNHNIKVKVLYEDEETGKTREYMTEEPTYQWMRSMPVEEYIEERPASHFTKVIEKDFYINDNGEKIILRNPDYFDVKGRFKPKTNEEYRKEYGVDHPYLNQDFADLKRTYMNGTISAKDKVDYENLLFITENMLKAQETVAPNQRLGLAVPFLEKHLFERTVESGGKNITDKGSSILDGIKRAFSKTDQDVDQNGIPTGQEDISNNTAKLATMDNDQVRHVPVRFSTKGEAENASYDVWGGVLNYVAGINRRNELEKELALVNGLEQILGDKANQPKSESGNLVLNNIYQKYLPELSARINKGGNIRLETLKSFVNSVMYNEEYFPGYDVFGINTHKALNTVMSLSSYTIMGLAPFSWATNFISGNIQNIIEGIGGRDFTMKDYKDSHTDLYIGGKYGCAVADMKSDFINGKVGNLSFFGQIMEIWDPLQGETENEFGHKTNWNGIKNIFSMGIYAGKIWGEWEIQMKTFLSFMKNYKVYNGKVYGKEDFITFKVGVDVENRPLSEIKAANLKALQEWEKLDTNLLDMFEKKPDGIVGIKDEFKDVFQLGSQQFSDIVAKLHAMQKKLNGSYSKIDKAYAEKSSIGRMMYYMKKWFLPIGVNRWGQMRTNYESMTPEQGFYITFWQTVGKDLTNFRFNVMKNWDTYDDFEKRAIKKTLADVGLVLTIIALYTLLFGYDPDDPDRFKKLREKGWASQAAVFLLLRVKSETEQFLPWAGIEEIKNTYSNPSLIFTQTSQYIDMSKLIGEHVLNLVGFDFNSSLYYSKKSSEATFLGMTLKDEGDSKLFAQMMKTFGGYTGKTFNPIDAIKGWEFFQKQR